MIARPQVLLALDQALSRERVVIVTGEVGIGVSTSFQQWCETSSHNAVMASCAELDPQRPLGAVVDMLTGPDVPIPPPNLDADPSRLVSVLSELAQTHVFVIDDAERLDEASTTLLLEVTQGSERHDAHLLVGTHSSETSTASLRRLLGGNTSSIATYEIPPLDAHEVAALAGIDDADRLAGVGGNPLAASFVDPARPFESLRTSVLERFDEISSSAQALTAALAVSPEPTRRDLLDVIGQPWLPVRPEAENAGLAVSDDTHVWLRHDEVRRIIYQAMPPLRRRFVHAAVLSGLPPGGDPTTAMHHAVGAGDVEWIVTKGPDLVRAAFDVGAYREAIAHTRHVLVFEHSVDESVRSELLRISGMASAVSQDASDHTE